MDDLSLTGKLWTWPSALKQENCLDVVERLFAKRQIEHTAPTVIPPNIFPDMDRATKRIHTAILNGETIGIFGDYDCDGVTAVAQLVRFFRRRDVQPWVRLPHRVHDGYGLKKSVIQEIVDAGVTLLITADTGITAVEEVALLKEHGVDTIITDHHHAREELPLAYATVHPALCRHPAPHPSGAGVVYKMIHALEAGSWDDSNSDLALAMLGTVADLVELRGDNRALVQLGLRALESIRSGPLADLRERCKSKDAPLTATDIAFRVAPRINAAGRMAEADIALRAVTEGGDALSMLDLLNEDRQRITKELCQRAVLEFDKDNLPPILVSVSSDYPHGIVGLIAGRLTEQFGRPSLVGHIDGTSCTASLRSPASYHIALGLKQCDELLQGHGGHAQAAGCTFDIKNLEAITERLHDDIESHVDLSTLVPVLRIDTKVETLDITLDLCRKLQTLEPFGQGNSEPLFLLQGITLKDTRSCGKNEDHLTGRIAGKKCVGFSLGSFAGSNETYDAVVRLEISEWNGRTEPQLVIVDVAAAKKSVVLS